MHEALTEHWQEYKEGETSSFKPLVAVCNLLEMNVMCSKPILEGGVEKMKMPTITNIADPVAKHL
jgi:hypothetical protein